MKMMLPLKTDKTVSQRTSQGGRRAAEMVYGHLRQEILSLRLEPGALVNRTQIQDRFGLSSTPVRDALIRLGEEGLVEIVAQSATRISLIDVSKARQAQFLRRALEQEAVETICLSAERSVTIELKALIDDHIALAERADLDAFDKVDRAFHRTIFESAGVLELHDMVRRRSGHIDRIRQLHLPQVGRMLEIIADHEAIVNAIKTGDAVAARLAIRNHLSRSLAYSPKLKEMYPGYFKA